MFDTSTQNIHHEDGLYGTGSSLRPRQGGTTYRCYTCQSRLSARLRGRVVSVSDTAHGAICRAGNATGCRGGDYFRYSAYQSGRSFVCISLFNLISRSCIYKHMHIYIYIYIYIYMEVSTK